MRILGIDYGDARTGIAMTDALNITAQGLETIHNEGSDKIILRRLDEIIEQYDEDEINPVLLSDDYLRTLDIETGYLKEYYKINDENRRTKIGAVYKSIAAADAFITLIALK